MYKKSSYEWGLNDMTIVGFNFSKVSAEKKNEKASGNIDVNISLPTIKSIEKKDDIAGIRDIIAIEFSLTMIYEPKIGVIELSGEILYQGDKVSKVLKTWKDKKILDGDVAL